MGARGPKKKTRARVQLEGNPSRRKRGRPSKVEAADIEPVLDHGALQEPPPCPELLRGKQHAQELWNKVTVQLVARQLLSEADLIALFVLCDNWQVYLDAREIAGDPYQAYVTYESGHVQAHPAVNRMQSASKTLSELWRKFGLTPIDREQVGVTLVAKTGGGGLGDFIGSKPK